MLHGVHGHRGRHQHEDAARLRVLPHPRHVHQESVLHEAQPGDSAASRHHYADLGRHQVLHDHLCYHVDCVDDGLLQHWQEPDVREQVG